MAVARMRQTATRPEAPEHMVLSDMLLLLGTAGEPRSTTACGCQPRPTGPLGRNRRGYFGSRLGGAGWDEPRAAARA